MERLESEVRRVGSLSGRAKRDFSNFMVEVSKNRFETKEVITNLLSFPAGVVFSFRKFRAIYGTGVLIPLKCALNQKLAQDEFYFEGEYLFGKPKHRIWEVRFYSNGKFYETLKMIYNISPDCLQKSSWELKRNYSYDEHTFIKILDFLINDRNVEAIVAKNDKNSKFLLEVLAKIAERNDLGDKVKLKLASPHQKGYNLLIFNS